MGKEEGEESLRRLVAELQRLEEMYNALQGQLGLIDAALSELQIANATLEGVKKEKKETSLFVPVGGGAYMKAALTDNEQVIMNIGAGVSKEKNIDEAIGDMRARITELQATRTKIEQQLSLLEDSINEKRRETEAIYERMRGGTRGV
jgi:prefoldin alpha subunit